MAKPFLTYAEQIVVLEKEKLLIVSDHVYAERMLQQVGYFALVGGYKLPFKNPTTRKYRDGTTFNDIVALYKFDGNLRELFLKYILKIERNIRSLLSYYFTEKFGEKQECYLNKANFTVKYVYVKKDLFAVVIAFRYLLENDDLHKFKKQLSRILTHYFDSSNALSEAELLEYMGFPPNWEKVSVYRK